MGSSWSVMSVGMMLSSIESYVVDGTVIYRYMGNQTYL